MFPNIGNKVAKSVLRILSTVPKVSATLALISSALLFVADANANDVNQSPVNVITEALFPASADYLLISYSLTQEILAVNDEVPLVRIYGNGRVHVHRPEYLKQSGDYEMHLTAAELQAICLEMMQKNVMAYRDQTVSQEIEEVERGSQVTHHVSDNVHSSIELNLHGVKLGTRGNAEAVGKRRHVVSNIQAKAHFYPNIRLIGDLAEIEERLNQLIYDVRLDRIQ